MPFEKKKIIIDGVFNHVGLDFWALKDLRKMDHQAHTQIGLQLKWTTPPLK